jgi:hypothetical protein
MSPTTVLKVLEWIALVTSAYFSDFACSAPCAKI